MKTKNVVTVIPYLFLFLSVVCVIFIFANSMQPSVQSNESSSIFVDLIANIGSFFSIQPDIDSLTTIVRKTAHIAEYFLLSCLISVTFVSFFQKVKSYVVHILFVGLSVAVIDEFIQTHVSGRSGQVSDVLIDFCGVAAGLLIVLLVITLLDKKSKSRKHRHKYRYLRS